MESYATLNDIPESLEMTDDDTVVIGKKSIIADEARYIAKMVRAEHLKHGLTELVLKTADLPHHLALMAEQVGVASTYADESGRFAAKSGQSEQAANAHAGTAKSFADKAEISNASASDNASRAQSHSETAQSHAEQGAVILKDTIAAKETAAIYVEQAAATLIDTIKAKDIAEAAADDLNILTGLIQDIEDQKDKITDAAIAAKEQAIKSQSSASRSAASESNASVSSQASAISSAEAKLSAATAKEVTGMETAEALVAAAFINHPGSISNATGTISTQRCVIKNAHWNMTLSEQLRAMEQS